MHAAPAIVPSEPSSHWLSATQCQVDDLDQWVQTATRAKDCPQATSISHQVPIYNCAALQLAQRASAQPEEWRRALMAEWAQVWSNGPGVLVVQGLYPDVAVVDAATQAFQVLIEDARVAGHAGDHFAKPGANDRVWNALEKLCLQAPEVFAAYYGNAMLATVCEAWLGPAYQVTSQINCVNPGGQAQVAHRDYHLGFFTAQGAERFALSTSLPCRHWRASLSLRPIARPKARWRR